MVGEKKTAKAYKWMKYKWLRPETIFPDGYNVFNEGIAPNDIRQGALGDCYFLGTLSSLAENPERIKRLFVT